MTAFALPSGGFLLLFGRIADLFGRRRLFLAGLAVFGLSSLLATLAWDPVPFLAGRALQGLGAAVIVPAGMSLLTTTFPEGPLRDRALGINGTVLALGFTVGMVAGGVLTDTLGWRSTMALLTGAALIVFVLAPKVLTESRPRRPKLDVPGAVTVTGGLLALIHSLSTAAVRGFGARTCGSPWCWGWPCWPRSWSSSPAPRHRWSPCRCCGAGRSPSGTWEVWSPSR